MKKITQYLSINLFYRIMLVLFIHSILLLTLNLSTAPPALSDPQSIITLQQLTYAFANSIIALSALLPIDIMIGAAIYALQLNYSNMMIPIMCSGCTRLGMVRFFIPVILFFGVVNFSLQEFAIRWSRDALNDIGIGQLGFLPPGSTQSLWLRNQSDILYIKNDKSSSSTELGSALLFKRDVNGNLSYIQKTDKLQKIGDELVFNQVTTYYPATLTSERSENSQIIHDFNFETVSSANRLPQDLPFEILWHLANLSDTGVLARFVYESYLYRRIASFFSPLAVVIIVFSCVPILHRVARYGLFLFSLTMIGFGSFILDRIIILLAENGNIASFYSGNAVIVLQILFAIIIGLRYERLR